MNQRCRFALDAFERAVILACDEQCDAFVVLGDLFDTSRPTPPHLSRVQQIIRAARDRSASGRPHDPTVHSPVMDFVLLLGNHDAHSDMDTDHALAPLAEPGVHVVTTPGVLRIGNVDLGLVPYRVPEAGVTSVAALQAALGACFSKKPRALSLRVLGVHMGIKDANTAPWLANSPSAIEIGALQAAMKAHGVRRAFAGDWHDARDWHRVWQCGALVPTGFDNAGMEGYGDVLVLDSETRAVERHNITGPRFLKCDLAQLYSAAIEGDNGQLYVSATVPADKHAEALEVLDALKRKGHVEDGEVCVEDDGDALIAARGAAMAAKGADTLDAALAGFVKEMSLDASVDRESVLARARLYLK
jgi:hypothetical protein